LKVKRTKWLCLKQKTFSTFDQVTFLFLLNNSHVFFRSGVVATQATTNTTLYVPSNNAVTFVCNLASTQNFPFWRGPAPGTASTVYNWEGFQDFRVLQDRLIWADNKRDLVLRDVAKEDEGLYSCSVTGIGSWSIQLIVRGNTYSHTKHDVD